VRLVLCGSTSSIGQLFTPDRDERDAMWSRLSLMEQVEAKRGYIHGYLDEIRSADAVVPANFAKMVGGGPAGWAGTCSAYRAGAGFGRKGRSVAGAAVSSSSPRPPIEPSSRCESRR